MSKADDDHKQSAKSPALGRMLSIDALRGLAALMVLVYHARASMWVGRAQLIASTD